MIKILQQIKEEKPYWLYDGLSLLSAIVTIVTAVVAIIKATIVVNRLEDGTYIVSYNKVLAFICVIICLLLIVCVIKIKKYGKILRSLRTEFSENYYGFLHDFRNSYFDILKEYKIGNYKNISDGVGKLTDDTKEFLQIGLDYLCQILQKSTGEKVCACIKLIENMGVATGIDKEKATVITFCRSKNTDKTRKANDGVHKKSIKIKENTDFYDILDEESENTNSYFYQGNLPQYDKDLRKAGKKYRNTTEDYEKYYKGTIVVPIRVNKSHLYYVSENSGYDIVGFLCVDSLSTNAFRNAEFDKDNNTNIVKSFAAEIYIILNKYNLYLQRIHGGY